MGDVDIRDAVGNGLRAMASSGTQFQAAAYRKAAAAVEKARPFRDAAGATEALTGTLTAKMLAHVMDIIAAAESGTPPASLAAAELERVSCLGPVAARRLADLGITGIADLRARRASVNLTAAQALSLEHHDDISKRIPRAEMALHEALLLAAAASTGCTATVTGSYRRGAASSGDVDVLLVGDLAAFMRELRRREYVLGALAEGGHKFMGIVRLSDRPARRLDVLATTREVYPYALLHFTGPMEFNVALRKHAISKGWKLSEKALDGATDFVAESEEDILRHMGVAYVAPGERSGTITAR